MIEELDQVEAQQTLLVSCATGSRESIPEDAALRRWLMANPSAKAIERRLAPKSLPPLEPVPRPAGLGGFSDACRPREPEGLSSPAEVGNHLRDT